MELQFSANQQYQLDAIRTVVDLFEGQPQAEGSTLALEGSLFGLTLTEKGPGQPPLADRRAGAGKLPQGPGGEWSAAVRCVGSPHPREGEAFPIPNFTVEMETGTGKTYVYLRTIYKLHEQYGFKKFVIVVPSVAVVHCRSVALATVHFPTLPRQAIVQFVQL